MYSVKTNEFICEVCNRWSVGKPEMVRKYDPVIVCRGCFQEHYNLIRKNRTY